ncbi:hypothetical protein J4209_03215 [Candidatus Woesearchaeota archaeon]|nr:hypothetical protein [Candidatus Woesearchaeota archaeon]
MSEIANGAHPFALAESKPAISEHAQEHAPPFRAAVLDRKHIGKRLERLKSHK